MSNRAAGFKSSTGGRTFAPSASAFRRTTVNFGNANNNNNNDNDNNNGEDDIPKRSLSSESMISTGNSFEDDEIDLFGDVVAPTNVNRPLPTADELVLKFEQQDREFEDDDDFFGTSS